MSTMYYSYPGKKSIGQTHFLGKDKGYHFTWCMPHLQFVDQVMQWISNPKKYDVITEYGDKMSYGEFRAIVESAKGQSLDERIE